MAIRKETGKPIIILFDEGNVLAHNRIYLQKLRNLFMNIGGYMLVISGTPDLFPAMDEIFSPIVRQFKKIAINQFKNQDETSECIRKPLEKLSIDPNKIFDFNNKADAKEIHELASGRPYEVQLICHMMFRRVQAKSAKTMRLDLGILEDVRRELETSQDITVRPVLAALRTLSRRQLRSWSYISVCDSRATLDQLWSILRIALGDKAPPQDTLREDIGHLIGKGILREETDGIVKFTGDEFDRIYCKYFAKEQRVNLFFPDWPPEVLWFAHLRSIADEMRGLASLSDNVGRALKPDIVDLATKLAQDDSEDVLVGSRPLTEDLYHIMIDYRNAHSLPLIGVELRLKWVTAESLYYAETPDQEASTDEFLKSLEPLIPRADDVGGSLVVERFELPVAAVDVLARKVAGTSNERLRRRLASAHCERVTSEYGESKNLEESVFHAGLALQYTPIPSLPIYCNNIGYLFMAMGNLDKAEMLIESAVKSAKENDTAEETIALTLALYNLATLKARRGQLNESLSLMNECIERAAALRERERLFMCLFAPRLSDGDLAFEEVWDNPDVLKLALEAKSTLESLIPPNSEG